MPVVDTPDGPIIVCIRGPRGRALDLCQFCGRFSERLCDYVVDVAAKKTCDARMCAGCVGETRGRCDYCREHTGAALRARS